MALDPNINTLEKDKFEEIEGQVVVRVKTLGGFEVPSSVDAITVTYPNSTTEVYAYKTGGTSGTTVMTVTVTYTGSTKDELLSAVKS